MERPLSIAESAPPERARPALELVESPPPAVRARRLFEEARKATLEHLRQAEAAIAQAAGLLAEVAEGGDLYAPGLRDFAGRLAEDLRGKARTFQALSSRQAPDQRPHRG